MKQKLTAALLVLTLSVSAQKKTEQVPKTDSVVVFPHDSVQSISVDDLKLLMDFIKNQKGYTGADCDKIQEVFGMLITYRNRKIIEKKKAEKK